MSFTELFIRRPVLSMVVSLLILLLGAQGLMSLQVRQYPEVEETTITITTAYTGASADLIQGFISTPIAKSVSSAEGVDYVTTQSRLGVSTVSVLTGGFSEAELREAGAVAVYHSIVELRNSLDEWLTS